MTAQFREKLIYEEQRLSMCTNPLGSYFAIGGDRPPFSCGCTALWRGYVGTWEIVDGRLYLVELHGELEDGRTASVATIFPDFPERVFAHWYSGTIRIPQGRMLEYVHMGYGSVYEQDLLLEINRGVLQRTHVHRNGQSQNDGPEGYEIGGMTVPAHGTQDRGDAP